MLCSDECLQDALCRFALHTRILHEDLLGHNHIHSSTGTLLHRRVMSGIEPCSMLAKASLLQAYWGLGLAEAHQHATSITRGAPRAS